jgi:hypothetical protein
LHTTFSSFQDSGSNVCFLLVGVASRGFVAVRPNEHAQFEALRRADEAQPGGSQPGSYQDIQGLGDRAYFVTGGGFERVTALFGSTLVGVQTIDLNVSPSDLEQTLRYIAGLGTQ